MIQVYMGRILGGIIELEGRGDHKGLQQRDHNREGVTTERDDGVWIVIVSISELVNSMY